MVRVMSPATIHRIVVCPDVRVPINQRVNHEMVKRLNRSGDLSLNLHRRRLTINDSHIFFQMSNTGLWWIRTFYWEIFISSKVNGFIDFSSVIRIHFCFRIRSASGCPIANRNKLRILESGGTIEQHKAAIAAATAMKFDPTNCPTTGCDGTGHINGTFLTHR